MQSLSLPRGQLSGVWILFAKTSFGQNLTFTKGSLENALLLSGLELI